MRTLFAKILLWFLLTIVVAIGGFFITTALDFSAPRTQQFPMSMLLNFQLREARHAWERWGPAGLAETLDRFTQNRQMQAFLTDANGRDLLTGQDHSELLRAAQSRPNSVLFERKSMVMARSSRDGRYWYFLLLPRRRWFGWIFHVENLWILLPVTLLCYLLARHLTAPVRQLQNAVQRFGQGDFSARAGSDRKDELGQLARTFDQMAERIQTLMAAERRLLLDISHELRSPLTRLSLAVELARSNEDQETALNRVQKEADRLNSMLGELLQVTRAEGDASTIRRGPVRLDLLLEDLAEDGVIEAEARGASLELKPVPAVTLEADSELLRRAVENVMRNAIRHAPPGSQIQMQAQASESTVTISVRDFGPGVPEEALGRIFDPFFRVDTDRNRASGGAGLGLAIARRAVDLHRGTLKARNAHPGLLVEIELPLVHGTAS
ncbi:MAG: HAMP domain-containing protein [Bryobacterales bacterium]|nr:HAMP domain-containing protein [Bryobacterales bacterium]